MILVKVLIQRDFVTDTRQHRACDESLEKLRMLAVSNLRGSTSRLPAGLWSGAPSCCEIDLHFFYLLLLLFLHSLHPSLRSEKLCSFIIELRPEAANSHRF